MRCIDVHCYFGKWGFPIYDMSVADVLALVERAEVEKAILMSAIRAAEQAPNLYLDTCASYADQDKVSVAVQMLGADRVLFGSGATEGSLFMQKGAILDADIGEEERAMVLYENACCVFGL